MKLKKANAALALLTFLAMLLHMGYSVYTYLTFYYNPVLTKAFAIPFIVLVCIHAVLGMSIVFFQGDSPRGDLYTRKNRKTVFQRLTAALIFPLLILHLNTFGLMQEYAGMHSPVILLLVFVELLFFGTVIGHIVTSFSNALVTLGWLTSPKVQTAMDRTLYVLGGVAFAIAAFAVVKGQIAMFWG